jgi:hypothetical protein
MLILSPLPRLSQPVQLLRSAFTELYTAIGLLVASSMSACIAAFGFAGGWSAVCLRIAERLRPCQRSRPTIAQEP